MRILIAEDDRISRHILEAVLGKWGYDVVSAFDGKQAWEKLQQPDAPKLAILDWMMPEMDGIDICRRLRKLETTTPTYVVILTALDAKKKIVEGLNAGANDYVTKPFDNNELRARVEVGRKVVDLQLALADRVEELQYALDHVKTLQGLIPICMHCRKVRDDKDAWLKVEEYLQQRSEAQFTHGLCPTCLEQHYPEEPSGSSTRRKDDPRFGPPD